MRNNRIDCTVIDKKKKVVLLEMSCSWVSNREIKCAEKTSKYAPLQYELRRRYPGYKIEQHKYHNRRARRELAKCQGKLTPIGWKWPM